MRARSGTLAATVASVVVAFVLVACSPADSGQPSDDGAPPSSSPTPSEVVTGSEETGIPRSDASQITVSREGFSILDSDGASLFEYTWLDEVDEAVEALKAAFGDEPVVAVIEGDGTHYPDYTTYSWGGFTLFDWVSTGKQREDYTMPAFISIVATDEADVDLVTENGISVGDPADKVQDLDPTFEIPGYETGNEYYFMDGGPVDPVDTSGPAIRVVVEDDVVVEVGYTYWSVL